MGRVTTRVPVRRIRGELDATRPDTLAVEEPLEIRIGGRALTVTMRTPGADIDLVHGFLLSEGLIGSVDDIATIRYCDGVDDAGANTYNVIDVTPADGVSIAPRPRAFVSNSACGVCGSSAIDDIRATSRFDLSIDDSSIGVEALGALPDRLRSAQATFTATGGTHAAALFDTDGTLLVVREDVGRHNALDKAVGWALREGRIPLRHTVAMMSSRVSFELVQKSVMAGIPIIAAVSAPSSLAAHLGAELDLTVVGFLRGASMNVYSAPQRVIGA
ncbi:formate dehydrogenase family accessory protein FdhD [Williamsia sp. Leaf354]|uniref:formate dehydrogenase accessory sulfurtransferase FdhD n=1 Tax=Williamsia sp. Leaf354 TaxID=1736349 RepID=UPI0006F25B2B|nr:formate dehydrogenase accessory sulfurtransferase FdhD [Williamsia sp. Leaf354]KQR98893.1 formate dehydrogenase family accessory protein FdhD [Williamsia sp. Leaf354]